MCSQTLHRHADSGHLLIARAPQECTVDRIVRFLHIPVTKRRQEGLEIL